MWPQRVRQWLGRSPGQRPAEPSAVRSLFDQAAEHAQPAWSLLFYALWHAHHLEGVSAEGAIDEVLDQAAGGGEVPESLL